MGGLQRHSMAVPFTEREGALALARAALGLAWEVDPAADVEGTLDRVRGLLNRLRVQVPPTAEVGDAVYAINEMLFIEWGFVPCAGREIGPRDDLLDRVVACRCGGPYGLGLLYLVCGRKLRLPMEAAVLPGLFLVRLRLGGGDVFLDPAASGVTLFPQDLGGTMGGMQRLGDREVLSFLAWRLSAGLPALGEADPWLWPTAGRGLASRQVHPRSGPMAVAGVDAGSSFLSGNTRLH